MAQNQNAEAVLSYPDVEPDMATKLVVQQLLYSIQRWDGKKFPQYDSSGNEIPGSGKTIEEIYKGYFGATMRRGPEYEPMLFRGTGGHGKTSCIVDAFKVFSQLTGMNPVFNINDNYVPNKRDALINIVHAAGATSSVELQLPVVGEEIVNGKKIQYVTSMPDRSFAIAKEVGFYMLYLDDFLCTNSDMQNMWMNVIQQRRYKSLDLGQDSYVLASGNLGYDDDSYVTEPSLPMKGRFPGGIYHLQETVEGFANRMNKKFGSIDNIGDAGVIEFIEKNPNLLTMKAEDRGDDRTANICTPRGLEAAIKKLRVYLGAVEDGALDFRGRPYVLSQEAIRQTVVDQIGPIAAADMAAHLIDLASGVSLLARDIIHKGSLSDKIDPNYAKFVALNNQNKSVQKSTMDLYDQLLGDASTAPSRDSHSFQLSDAMAREVVSILATRKPDDPDNARIYTNFAKGVQLLDTSMISFAYHRLAWRLKNLDTYTDNSGPSPRLDIQNVSKPISVAAANVLGYDDALQVTRALTGAAKYAARPKVAKPGAKPNIQVPVDESQLPDADQPQAKPKLII